MGRAAGEDAGKSNAGWRRARHLLGCAQEKNNRILLEELEAQELEIERLFKDNHNLASQLDEARGERGVEGATTISLARTGAFGRCCRRARRGPWTRLAGKRWGRRPAEGQVLR